MHESSSSISNPLVGKEEELISPSPATHEKTIVLKRLAGRWLSEIKNHGHENIFSLPIISFLSDKMKRKW